MYIGIDQLMMTPSSLFLSFTSHFSTCGNEFVRDGPTRSDDGDHDHDESNCQINFDQRMSVCARALLLLE